MSVVIHKKAFVYTNCSPYGRVQEVRLGHGEDKDFIA